MRLRGWRGRGGTIQGVIALTFLVGGVGGVTSAAGRVMGTWRVGYRVGVGGGRGVLLKVGGHGGAWGASKVSNLVAGEREALPRVKGSV